MENVKIEDEKIVDSKIENLEGLKGNKQIECAKQTVDMFDKLPENIPTTEKNMYEKMIQESNGCGEEGLYSCQTSPHLAAARDQVLNKFKKHYSMGHIPTDVLIEEIRNRQLREPLIGTVDIASNGTVGFSIDKLTWPTGKYNVRIIYVSEELKKSDDDKKEG